MQANSKPQTFLKRTSEGLIINRVQNVEPIIDDVTARRNEGIVGSSNMRHVARVPTVVLEEACRAAGIELHDRDAVRDLMHKKITSGDWSKFMVHERGY